MAIHHHNRKPARVLVLHPPIRPGGLICRDCGGARTGARRDGLCVGCGERADAGIPTLLRPRYRTDDLPPAA